jgi:uncharacterized SAM-binding protein YcdF (DUF218 family)
MAKQQPASARKSAKSAAAARPAKAASLPRRSKARRLTRLFWPLALTALLAILIGFVVFVERVSVLREPVLAKAADGIVVLTGGKYRLEKAVALLAEGKGKRLLISGVHASLNKHDVLNAVGGGPEKLESLVDIDHVALQTVGNAVETAKWAASRHFRSIILVTNNYHIPRSLLELRRAAPEVEILPFPVINSDLTNGAWLLHPDTVRVLFAEYIKYLGALTRPVLPVPVSVSSMLGTGKP